MTTRKSKAGVKVTGGAPSAIRSRFLSCAGSASESQSLMLGDLCNEADPINLLRAICIVYDRWIRSNKKPGSDNMVHSSRLHRPALVAEIVAEWNALTGCDPDDDLFPYHESYVIRKWVLFRKKNDAQKVAFINAAKQ